MRRVQPYGISFRLELGYKRMIVWVSRIGAGVYIAPYEKFAYKMFCFGRLADVVYPGTDETRYRVIHRKAPQVT